VPTCSPTLLCTFSRTIFPGTKTSRSDKGCTTTVKYFGRTTRLVANRYEGSCSQTPRRPAVKTSLVLGVLKPLRNAVKPVTYIGSTHEKEIPEESRLNADAHVIFWVFRRGNHHLDSLAQLPAVFLAANVESITFPGYRSRVGPNRWNNRCIPPATSTSLRPKKMIYWSQHVHRISLQISLYIGAAS